ncbi:MAG: hypothetical protein ABIH78_02125 [Candidatus Peregrinibacteria bacterium]
MIVRKILAGILAFLFVVLLLPLAMAFGFYKTFSDSNFYKGDLVDLAYEFIVEKLPENIDLKEFPYLTTEDVKEIFGTVFDKDDLGDVLADMVSQFKNATVEDNMVTFTISLEAFVSKGDLIGKEIAGHMYDNLDPCESGVVLNLDEVKCIPDGMARADFENAIKTVFEREVVSTLPDKVVLNLAVPDFFKGDVVGFLESSINLIFLTCAAVALFLLFLIGLIIFRPWTKVVKWVFGTLFVASLLFLLLLLALRFLPEIIVTMKEYEIYVSFYSFIISEVMDNVLFIVLPIFGVGFVMWIIGMVFDRGKIKKIA